MSLAVEETDPLAVFAVDVTTAHPAELRRVIRRNAYRGPTGGMAHGFTHGNLAIIPESYALDFARFCQRNPRPCPIVGVSDTGDPRIPTLGADLDIRTDIPSYNIYRDGVLESSVPDIMEHWRDDMVAFVIGCSYSFEEALVQGGVPLRHLETGEVPPMWKTSIPLAEAGPFGGGMVVSMRPMTPANAIKASAITARFPHTHGMPVHFGDPAAIGIADIAKPDWGDVMVPREGEVPVFWACGVTPQNAIREAGIPMVITHTPAHMLITDVPSAVS
jgi:uncharacterized protein YcsI (UPF0317 family)